MLVLSRRITEAIQIGQDIEVRILKLRMPNGEILRVRGRIEIILGISAPRSTPIRRTEPDDPPAG